MHHKRGKRRDRHAGRDHKTHDRDLYYFYSRVPSISEWKSELGEQEQLDDHYNCSNHFLLYPHLYSSCCNF